MSQSSSSGGRRGGKEVALGRDRFRRGGHAFRRLGFTLGRLDPLGAGARGQNPDQQQRALKALAAILRPGGRLLLGWNTDKIADPVAAGLTPG